MSETEEDFVIVEEPKIEEVKEEEDEIKKTIEFNNYLRRTLTVALGMENIGIWINEAIEIIDKRKADSMGIKTGYKHDGSYSYLVVVSGPPGLKEKEGLVNEIVGIYNNLVKMKKRLKNRVTIPFIDNIHSWKRSLYLESIEELYSTLHKYQSIQRHFQQVQRNRTILCCICS